MSIAKYISELLFDYECVVLPGLGGFITNIRSATINRVTHQFNPPYSQIFFNVHLTTNDGLLVNYIAKSESLSYAAVRNQVDEFVKNIKLQLDAGEKALIENIGTLQFDENRNIRFEQVKTINYNLASFGLSSLISPTIKRKTDEEKLRGLILAGSNMRKKSIDRKPTISSKKRKRGFVKSSAVVVLLALFGFSVIWGVVKRDRVADYWQEQASVFPFNSSVAKYQPRVETEFLEGDKIFDEDAQIETKHETDVLVEADKTNESLVEKETRISETKELVVVGSVPSALISGTKNISIPKVKESDLSKPKVKPAGKLYYVVAGSFSKEINATKLVETLKLKGYEALIADTTKKGLFRVAYFGVKDLAVAKEKLYAVRLEDNFDAWIFRK